MLVSGASTYSDILFILWRATYSPELSPSSQWALVGWAGSKFVYNYNTMRLRIDCDTDPFTNFTKKNTYFWKLTWNLKITRLKRLKIFPNLHLGVSWCHDNGQNVDPTATHKGTPVCLGKHHRCGSGPCPKLGIKIRNFPAILVAWKDKSKRKQVSG